MTILEVYKQHGVMPHKFTVEGIEFEHSTMEHSNGLWYAYVWEMQGKKRKIHSCEIALTEQAAIEKLVTINSYQQENHQLQEQKRQPSKT